MTPPPDLKAAALAAVAHGFTITPFMPRDKGPRDRHWEARATTDPAEVARLWDRDPANNYGVLTGSRYGLIVLDVDYTGDLVELIMAERVDFPETYVVHSGHGGAHVYLRHPGGPIRGGRSLSGRRGVSVLADGAFVTGAGSIHPNGTVYRSPDPAAVVADPSPALVNILARNRPLPPPPWPYAELAAYRRREKVSGRARLLAGAPSHGR